MPKQIFSNTCGPYETNSDWSQSFIESMAALSASRGTQGMTYDEKQAIWMTLQTVQGAGDSDINITLQSNSSTITSSALIGKQVTAIFGDSFVKVDNFTIPDENGTFSFTDDTILYAGRYKIAYS